jgi:hypothetical protein
MLTSLINLLLGLFILLLQIATIKADQTCPRQCILNCPPLTNCDTNGITCTCNPDGAKIAGVVIGSAVGLSILCAGCCWLCRCCCFSYRRTPPYRDLEKAQQIQFQNNSNTSINHIFTNPSSSSNFPPSQIYQHDYNPATASHKLQHRLDKSNPARTTKNVEKNNNEIVGSPDYTINPIHQHVQLHTRRSNQITLEMNLPPADIDRQLAELRLAMQRAGYIAA